MITKVSKNIQRAELFTCRLIEIIQGSVFVKNLPNSNKCIQVCTELRIKTKKLANKKKMKKKYT